MFKKLLQNKENLPIKKRASGFLLTKTHHYLSPLLEDLDAQIDKRLVRTLYDLFITILIFRNRAMGLVLSELGGYICGFAHAPAGTKRISNLLRSKKWEHDIIDSYLFERTKNRLEAMRKKGQRALFLWDDSRIEKPESWFSEGLCSVWSSKGKRLTKIKRGFYRPPTSRICVPGIKWTGVILSNLGGIPSVCQMTWWTSRGKHKEDPDNIMWRLLQKIKQHLGRCLHVLDRGYANEKVLRYLLTHQQDFLIRWKKNHLLNHIVKGTKKTHLLARSFKAKAYHSVWDKERKKYKRISIAWVRVNHVEYPDNELFVLIVRDKNNHVSPMYLLTSIAIEDACTAWEMCYSYMHRWEVEQAFRFGKSELALESPRLWFWANRLKLMAIVTLVYDFLLKLIRHWKPWVCQLLKNWAHRTGNRYRNASIPIYRLRQAISACLFFAFAQNSG